MGNIISIAVFGKLSWGKLFGHSSCMVTSPPFPCCSAMRSPFCSCLHTSQPFQHGKKRERRIIYDIRVSVFVSWYLSEIVVFLANIVANSAKSSYMKRNATTKQWLPSSVKWLGRSQNIFVKHCCKFIKTIKWRKESKIEMFDEQCVNRSTMIVMNITFKEMIFIAKAW